MADGNGPPNNDAAIQAITGATDMLGAGREEAARLPTKIHQEWDETVGRMKTIIEGDEATIREGIASIQKQKATLAAFAERTKQQADYTRSHPWANVATTILGGLASSPKMPGWLQGMGKATLALNPPAPALEAHYQDLAGQIAGMDQQLIQAGGRHQQNILSLERLRGDLMNKESLRAAREEAAVSRFEQGIDRNFTSKGNPANPEQFVRDFMRVNEGKIPPNQMLTAAQEALNAQHAAANSVRETQEREARWKMREIDLPKLKEQEKLHETFAKFDLGMKENLASFTEGLREKYDLAKKAQEGDKFDKQESSIIALMRTTLAFLDKAEYMTSQPRYRRFMWTAEGVKEKLLPKGAQSQDFTDWDNLVNQEAVRIGGLLSKSGAMARILTTQAGQDLMRSLSMSSWRQNPGQVDSAIRTARAHAVDVIRGIRDTANSGNRATPATDALLDAEWKRQEGFFHQPGEQPKEAPPPASRPATGTFKLNNGKTYKQTVDKNGNITVIEVKGP